MENTIVLSTHNKGKLKEFNAIADRLGLRFITRDEAGIPHDFDVVEDGETLEENSYKKAYEIMKMCGHPTMADDSGLMVDALNGAPGVHSARYGGEDGNDKKNVDRLLKDMENVPSELRTAHFETVITLVYPNGETLIAKGQCPGRINETRSGEKGFGYDPVFQPDGYEDTFGTMGPEVKNQISHRAKALQELERLLKERK